MCAGLVGQVAARGMDALALAFEHSRDRILGEPIDFEIGHQLAELARDRDIALRMTEADRRGDQERPPAASSARVQAEVGAGGADEIPQHEVDVDRVADSRHVAGPSSGDERPPSGLGQRFALGMRPSRVRSPWITSAGHSMRAQRSPVGLGRRGVDAAGHATSVSGVGLEAPVDAVLDLLGRVRLVEAFAEEELEEAPVVPSQ